MNMSDSPMRILLVAYDYPPLSSPQAIRWYYLTRQLVEMGVEVHVLAPDLAGRNGISLDVPLGIVMHRCAPGGLAGGLVRIARVRQALWASKGSLATDSTQTGPLPLNWKGKLRQQLERLISHWVYPDNRGLWMRPASVALDALISTIRPDVLITSHEPAVTLQLGLHVAARVPAWLADLGDPVLAEYTPKRWRKRAKELEADVCRVATAVSVTTIGTRELLLRRHALDSAKVFVISQGFDDTLPAYSTIPKSGAREGPLHLLYTGRFYSFRDPTALLAAVVALKQTTLTIVTPDLKPEYLAYVVQSNGRIAFLREQPHAKVLELQRDCDLLVNIGNTLSEQTPGKLFEYLGSGKPILHCYYADDDPANELLATWRRGWSCHNDQVSLQAFLSELEQFPGRLNEAAVGNIRVIKGYGWSQLAGDLFNRCTNMRIATP